MRGTVAKKIRKILYAMQVRKEVKVGNEYRINATGTIRIFGAHEVYEGLKRQHRAWRGFRKPKPQPRVSRRAREEWRRSEVRERKRYARQRRRTREREALEDATWECPCGYMSYGPLCTKCGRTHAA